MKIARCMSTQHPDNVTQPFFAENSIISGDDEIQEAYYHYSHLNIKEQMWDSEGKEVDNFVVKKLLTKYPQFFNKKKLGKDVYLTLRVPNPSAEKNDAKILMEALHSIPRSFDTAKQFYGEEIAPIFEVILPMTTSSDQLQRVEDYYKKYVVGLEDKTVGKVKLREWIGEFKPSNVNIIPLVEDKQSMLQIKTIVQEFIQGKNKEYQRVFLARSDPALNYGWLSAILLNKWAVAQLDMLQEEMSVDIYPMIGVGSAPFRGNFRPDNINCLKGYPSVQTFSIQSAFKYDYPHTEVKNAVDEINETKRGKAFHVDTKVVFDLIEKYSEKYSKHIPTIGPWVQKVSRFIPKRRKRKLHVGLFGYSRGVGGFQLPRAISYCASLYSLGLPPEIIGLDITEEDTKFLEDEIYKNFFGDVKDALQFANLDTIKKISPQIAQTAQTLIDKFNVEINNEHKRLTTEIVDSLSTGNQNAIKELVTKAAWIRKFLG